MLDNKFYNCLNELKLKENELSVDFRHTTIICITIGFIFRRSF